jgi:hypothetical protein
MGIREKEVRVKEKVEEGGKDEGCRGGTEGRRSR